MITMDERKYLLGGMEYLLKEYGYSYREDALIDIIDEWEANKAGLIELFKNHPNYVEGKFMIAFDQDYARECDKRKLKRFENWLNSNRQNIILPSYFAEKYSDLFTFWFFDPAANWLFSQSLHTNNVLEEEEVDHLNRYWPEIHAHVGQKRSRVINKCCKELGLDKLEDYNKMFARYSDAINPLKIVRHTILSINPLDYLTMSFGNSWASCHTIDKTNRRGMPNDYSGCYSSGTISYMLDQVSMVFYTVDREYNGTDYWDQPKVNRQMFHYGEEKLVQGRLYPQGNDGNVVGYDNVRGIVQKIMADILDVPNYWTKRSGCEAIREYTFSSGTQYEDYYNFEDCSISRLKGSENEQYITIGHNPICVECGLVHEVNECINCCSEPMSNMFCEHCGCMVPINEDQYININGHIYCFNCVETCEDCGGYSAPGEDTYECYEIICGEVYYVSVCEHCRDRHCTYCEEEWWNDNNVTYIDGIGHVSDPYFENNFYTCEHCGAVHRNDEVCDCQEKEEEDEEIWT